MNTQLCGGDISAQYYDEDSLQHVSVHHLALADRVCQSMGPINTRRGDQM